MITINDIQYRNLEEQVQKNKEDIAAHYNMDRVLADFGIRIIGRVSTPEELPDPATYVGAYGDAYAVGDPNNTDIVENPFVFYIWTRPDPDAGYPNAYWFNMGELSIVGPQGVPGEQGPAGPTGTRGSMWYYGTAVPANASQYLEGDLYLRNNGDIYQITKNGTTKYWTKRTNIMGAEGPQGDPGETGPEGAQGLPGPAGPKGDTGALCKIVGSITSVSQLPTPTESIRYDGYTQTINDETHLWVITGDTSLSWVDLGVIAGGGGGPSGTQVMVNGVLQETWDASNVLTSPLVDGTGFVYTKNGTISAKQGQQQISSSGVSVDVPVLRNINGTTDVIRDAALTAILNLMAGGTAVPDRYPNNNTDGALRKNQATPRGYVDQLVENAMEQAISDAELIVNNAVANCLSIPEVLGDPNEADATFVGIANDDGSQMGYTFQIKTHVMPANDLTMFYPEPNKLYILYSKSSEATVSTLGPATTQSARNFALIAVSNNVAEGTTKHLSVIFGKSSSNAYTVSADYHNKVQIVNNSTANPVYVLELGMFPV